MDTWSARTPLDAYSILSRPDVTVTNNKDKVLQLPKVLALNSAIMRMMRPITPRDAEYHVNYDTSNVDHILGLLASDDPQKQGDAVAALASSPRM